MKYDKLVEIRKKARLYEGIVNVTFLVATVLAICMLFYIGKDVKNNTLLYITMGVKFVITIIAIVFMWLEGKMNRSAEDYFILRIMQVLNDHGYYSDKFEIIEETRWRYKVGFHNQTVDYTKLQNIIDKEAAAMSKIMKYNIRVKLI